MGFEDFPHIYEVEETEDQDLVNILLKRRWIIIAIATGQDKDQKPVIRYSMGRTDVRSQYGKPAPEE